MKFLVPLVDPLGVLWLTLTVLSCINMWKRRWSRAAPLAGCWLLLTLVTCSPVPDLILATLEQPWTAVDLEHVPAVDAVVCLGGAAEPSKAELVGVHFDRSADRLATAIELVRKGKAPTLVVGGGGCEFRDGVASEADAVKRWCDSWQMVPAPVISLGLCADTHDEATKVAVMARTHGWQRVMLVTSASHMRRADACFKRAGLQVECAPCNYLSSFTRNIEIRWFDLPRHGGLEIFSIWSHEFIGWWVYRWRGWV